MGFPGGSEGKESACNAGDLGLIPGWGRSPGDADGYPTPVFSPGGAHGQGNLAATVHGDTKGQKRLSD